MEAAGGGGAAPPGGAAPAGGAVSASTSGAEHSGMEYSAQQTGLDAPAAVPKCGQSPAPAPPGSVSGTHFTPWTDAERDVVRTALEEVRQKLAHVSSECGLKKVPRLVAVTKTKPPELIQLAYDLGHRVFGENYVHELIAKAPVLPADIRWHFIGHLQTNKAKQVLEIPNLEMIESVHSGRLANKLNALLSEPKYKDRPPLSVMFQVNTSGEQSKHGAAPADTVPLCQHIMGACPRLKLVGLFTVGQYGTKYAQRDFQCLVDTRQAVAEALGVPPEELELSMGMSADWELAVRMGSTNVRIGTTVFGARNSPATSPNGSPPGLDS